MYDVIGPIQAPSYTSLGFQATSTSAVGDYVQLGSGPRRLDAVDVMMVSWACGAGSAMALSCTTTPGSTFEHSLTLDVYAAGGTDVAPTVGALLASSTADFDIPFRPSATPDCPSAGQWRNPSTNTCHFGFAHRVTFDDLPPVALPNKVIWTISYDTQSYGAHPIGSDGPFNSLNVALSSVVGAPFAGADLSPQGRFLASSWTGAYCAGATANPTSELRFDTCAGLAAQRPLASITTTDIAVGDDFTVHPDEIGVEVTTEAWNAVHDPTIPSGAESVVANVWPTQQAQAMSPSAPAALLNGHLKLATYAATQQARLTHFLTPGSVSLAEILDSQPSYWLFNDLTQSENSPAGPSGGSLQITFSCTSVNGTWNGTVLISPGGDQPGYLDERGQPAQWNTWQQFKFPTANDPQGSVIISGGAALVRPPGLATGFANEEIADLTAACGTSPVTSVRANQGRTPRSRIVSYVDLVSFLGDTYDFEFVAPSIPSPVTTQVFGHSIGGENDITSEWSKDHFEPKLPGTETVVTDAVATSGAGAPASAANGSLRLTTIGNASSALAQQARVVHHFTPGSAPTLTEMLASRPQYSVLTDSGTSNPDTGLPGAGALQFGVQCGSWLTSVLLSPSDANPPYRDVSNALPTFDTWQTFRYPDPTDPASKLFVATDAGTPPGGMPIGFGEVSVLDLLDRCGTSPLVDARVNQGRNSYPAVVSYFDDVEFSNHTFDFVTSVAPTITSGAPSDGDVGQPYSFQLTAVGTPDPAITVSGTLPPGTGVDSTGLLSGTPTAAGEYTFEVRAAERNASRRRRQRLDHGARRGPATSDRTVDPRLQPRGTQARLRHAPGTRARSRSVKWPSRRSADRHVLEVQFTDLAGIRPGLRCRRGVAQRHRRPTRPRPGSSRSTPAGPRALVSSVNFVAGQTVANAVIAPCRPRERCASTRRTPPTSSSTSTVGSPPGRAFTGVGPERVFDTRPGQSPHAMLRVATSPIGGSDELEVTVDRPAGYRAGVRRRRRVAERHRREPDRRRLRHGLPVRHAEAGLERELRAGQTVANAVIAPVSADGTVCFYSSAEVDLVVDVNGWLKDVSGYTRSRPSGCSTRGRTTVPTRCSPSTRPSSRRRGAAVDLVDMAGVVPASGVSAVSINVTATNPEAPDT